MRYFGTDGIRRKSTFFDTDFLTLFALGVTVLPARRVVVGRDTRISGESIAETIEKVLLQHGVDVTDVGVVPSPCLALCTRELGCDYGIMVTASHNPPLFNGLKLFSAGGSKIPLSEELRLEAFLNDPFYLPPTRQGTFDRADGYAIYLRHAQDVFPSVQNKKILMDCAYGAASGFADRIFRALGAEVVAVCNEKRGDQINVQCGATCIFNVIERYDKTFDAAFSCDGDADRVFCYKGNIFDGDALVYLAAMHAFKTGTLRKNVVCGTVTTNSAYENAYIEKGITFYRSDVGDREVHELMRKTGAEIGGETSGHVIFDKILQTGDGLYTAAMFCSLTEALDDYGLYDLHPYPTCRTELVLNEKDAAFLRSRSSGVYSNQKGVYALVRVSGTEPVIRIQTESKDREKAETKMNELRGRAWEVLLDHQLD